MGGFKFYRTWRKDDKFGVIKKIIFGHNTHERGLKKLSENVEFLHLKGCALCHEQKILLSEPTVWEQFEKKSVSFQQKGSNAKYFW